MQHDAAPIATNRHPAQENELVVSASEEKKLEKNCDSTIFIQQ
jgi:hypothetical protein